MPTLLINKKAHFDYSIIESYQAGLSLSGAMVKQIRGGKVVINGLYIVENKGNLSIIGLGNETLRENVNLLLNKKEKNEIIGRLSEKGLSCVPLNIKTVGRWVKSEIAIVKGKKQHDKKDAIKNRDIQREVDRDFKQR
jgi:SsrA-binding protein